MLIKVILGGIAVCFVNLFLSSQLKEFILPVEIIFICLSGLLLIEYIDKIFSEIFELAETGVFSDNIYSSCIKGVVICLITKFSSDICDENNCKVISGIIDLTGRVMLLIISLPFIKSILQIAFELAK